MDTLPFANSKKAGGKRKPDRSHAFLLCVNSSTSNYCPISFLQFALLLFNFPLASYSVMSFRPGLKGTLGYISDYPPQMKQPLG